ncbi:MAG TPA: MBL fold metallo-hydrolase [Candidatus Didemnitutus sp.]|nr:MBL fold metallo-hydrolase [Candidatus Didemnitutus sp.]
MHNSRSFPTVAVASLLLAVTTFADSPAKVPAIAPDVYFYEGNNSLGHCNNGWVVFDDYVLVVDANFPSGARIALPELRTTTDKPIRFVVDTHFHPDHSFGNRLWAMEGALPVAHATTREIVEKTGPSRWEASARMRPDVAASSLQLPALTYTAAMTFDDGRHCVELHWFGVAHTRGDTLVWLPKEKILFTGDVCVNGPHNYVADGDLAGWIKVLDAAKTLGAEKVCPGHGPMGGPEIIADQQAYFIELRRSAQAFIDAKKTPAEVKAAAPELAATLRKNAHIARYVPAGSGFIQHVEKAYVELGGEPLPK